MIKRKQIDKSDAISVFTITQKIPVKLVKVDIPKALAIAINYNIYAYDAYFLQCALSSSSALLSLDKKLNEVAQMLSIDVLEL